VAFVAGTERLPVRQKPKEKSKKREKGHNKTRKFSGRRASQRSHTMFSFIPRLVCPGDILLTRVPFKLLDISTYKSSGIQVFTSSRFSHAALCIEPGLLIEAIGTGVCRLALGQTAARARKNVQLLRLKLDVPGGPFVAQRAADRGHQYLSRGYSVPGAVGAKIAGLRDKERGDLFCSQLVARAYEEAGCPLVPGKSPEEITPGDISKSPLLRDVTDLALLPITDDQPPAFYLDDATHFERPIHWEVQTKLGILRSGPVVKELSKIGRNPESFFELEKILRTCDSPDLDRMVHDQLQSAGFKEQHLKKTRDAMGLSQLSDVFGRPFVSLFEPKEEDLERHNDATLKYLIEMTKSAILSFENDIKSREHDIRTWLRYKTPCNEQTFSYLIDLQRERLPVSKQILSLYKRQELAFLGEEKRRQRTRPDRQDD
jgi:hypothetical protein